MITVDVVVEFEHGSITVRVESARDEAAGLTVEASARRLIDRAAGAAAYAADPPVRRGVYAEVSQ